MSTMSKNITLINILSLLLITQIAEGQSLLWKITKPGNEKPSYLYGTIHIKDKRVFAFTDTLLAVLKDCDAVVLELNLGAQTSAELSSMLMLDDGQTLKDFYTAEQIAELRRVLRTKAGIPLAMFMNMKPVALLTTLSSSYFEEDMPYALDEYFQRYAVENGKSIEGLETVAEQFTALSSVTPEQIYQYVVDTATNDAMVEPMISAYLRADFEKLSQLLAMDSMMVSYSQELIIGRNIKMADRIAKLPGDEMYFIAIGAGHLRGEKGVVELLGKQGYNVDPVYSETQAVAPVISSELKWERYTAPAYTVEVPAGYSVTSHAFPSGEGMAEIPALQAKSAGVEYSVVQMVLPEGTVSEQTLIAKAEQAAQMMGGSVESAETEKTPDGGLQAEIIVHLPGIGDVYQKHICSSTDYILLQAVVTGKETGTENALHFLNSFKLK